MFLTIHSLQIESIFFKPFSDVCGLCQQNPHRALQVNTILGVEFTPVRQRVTIKCTVFIVFS